MPSTRLAERWEPVDDLSAIVNYFLADGSYDEESIVSWLRSRQLELANRRPLDVLREGDFDAVLTAAETTLNTSIANEEELVPLPGGANRAAIPARLRSG